VVEGVVNKMEVECCGKDGWVVATPPDCGTMLLLGGRELLAEAFLAFLAFSFSYRFSAPEMFLCVIKN
jgi:hypothetical protein